jgi:hypothetical protein
MHEIRPDETTATGHDDVLRSKRLFSHIHNPTSHTPLLEGSFVSGVSKIHKNFR